MEIKPMTIEFCQKQLSNTKRIIKGLNKELEKTKHKESIDYLNNELNYGNYELKHWESALKYAKDYYKK